MDHGGEEGKNIGQVRSGVGGRATTVRWGRGGGGGEEITTLDNRERELGRGKARQESYHFLSNPNKANMYRTHTRKKNSLLGVPFGGVGRPPHVPPRSFPQTEALQSGPSQALAPPPFSCTTLHTALTPSPHPSHRTTQGTRPLTVHAKRVTPPATSIQPLGRPTPSSPQPATASHPTPSSPPPWPCL